MPNTSLILPVRLAALACLPLLLSLSPAEAFAWSAVAAWSGKYSYTSFNEETPEMAKKNALESCRQTTMADCEILGDAVTRTATVIAIDTRLQSTFTVSRQDPLEAVRLVMTSCRLHHPECALVGAYWDGGPSWWATASTKDAWHIMMGSNTEEEAKRAAVRGCEERTQEKGSCVADGSGNGAGFVAIAKTDDRSGVGFGKTAAEAGRNARKECGDERCRVSWSDQNPGLVPPPASMKQVRKMVADGITRMRKLGRWIN